MQARVQAGIAVALLCGAHGLAAPPAEPPRTGGPRPETVQAFLRYSRQVESLLDSRLRGEEGFLSASAAQQQSLRDGRILCEPRNKKGEIAVRSGLIHDWVGTVFIPGVGIDQVLKLLEDYDNHKNTYRAAVIASRTLAREGNNFRVYLRVVKRKVTTVILDTEHEVRYQRVDAMRWHSRSRSTRIQEVEQGGKPNERVLPPGRGHGYLWRLNSYWMMWEKDGGVYLECEVLSLTRPVPQGLAWLLNPIVRSLPRDALIGTLEATRTALAGGSR
jgi:hypothetical protein